MRIAIYGGSFNPIHKGHEQIVEYICNNKELNIDKVIVIPVGIPSHKENTLKDSNVRLEMCREVFKDNQKVFVSDIEIKENKTSYTYDTLIKIIEIYGKENEYYEVIGMDSLKNLKTWKNYKKLLKLTKFIVFKRKNYVLDEMDKDLLENERIIILENEYYNFSSTEIRERIKNKKDISDFINTKIYKTVLYKNYMQ